MTSGSRPRTRNRNFHVPLTPELYARLQREARRSGHPATEIAREAIRAALGARARKVLYTELRDYADRHAGGAFDLDSNLEAAGLESLRDLP